MTRSLLVVTLLATLAAQFGCGGDGYGGDGNGSYTPPTPPPASRWQSLAPLSVPRQEHGVAVLNGEIYVIGGFSSQQNVLATVEAFNPTTNTWRSVAPLLGPLHHVNVAVARGRIFVVGALEGSFQAVGVTLEYDPAADMWLVRAPMPIGSERGASGVAAIGDLIYVAGGLRGGSVADFSVYDAASNTWQTLQNMPTARDHLVGAAANGRFYAIAGRNSGGLRGDVEIYDPATPGWSMGAPIPTPRGGCGGAVLDGRIYVFGGEGNSASANGTFDANEAYDPVANSWATLEVMRTPRHGIGAGAVGGVLYVPGGATRQGFGAVTTNESFTP